MTLIEVLECAHVRPEDRLVLRVENVSVDDANEMREQITAAGFSPRQVTIVSNVEEMIIIEGANA